MIIYRLFMSNFYFSILELGCTEDALYTVQERSSNGITNGQNDYAAINVVPSPNRDNGGDATVDIIDIVLPIKDATEDIAMEVSTTHLTKNGTDDAIVIEASIKPSTDNLTETFLE